MSEHDLSLPAGAWDSHVHVVDEDNFPLHPNHPYRPRKADLDDLLAFQKTQHISHVCLIAFSIYHTDNSSLLDALTRLKGRGRGVVCVDPETVTDEELQSMHKLGARGVRLNLRTRWERMDEQGFRTILEKYADRIRSLGWCLQLFVALDQISLIAPIVPSLGVPVVFDHLGSPDKSKPPRLQTGYTEFLHLLKSGLAWTKLSGTYRFDTTPELDEYIKEILRMAPDRVVWASDWPHSGGTEANPGGVRTKVQDYRVVDDPSFVRRCKGWCGGDEGLISKIWVDNPRRLWQYDGDD